MQIVIDIPNTIYQRYLKDDWDLGDADVVRNRKTAHHFLKDTAS